MKTPTTVKVADVGPIVSSSHLASGQMPALSEMEYALIIVGNAFSRWTIHCMNAAGIPGLTHLEIMILHSANHRDREKTMSDLCMILNIEDTHLISYAIKKLVGLGLVASGKRGKEKTISITASGASACERYKEVREAVLISSIRSMGLNDSDVSETAAMLRALSGQYDQAARAAASL